MAKNSSGFTLIECLVALLIISIVLASSTRTIALSINDVRDGYIREVASWVAKNQFNEYFITNSFPDLGSTKKFASMSGLDFIVNTQVTQTNNPYFRQIEIRVSPKAKPSYTSYKTVSFISQY